MSFHSPANDHSEGKEKKDFRDMVKVAVTNGDEDKSINHVFRLDEKLDSKSRDIFPEVGRVLSKPIIWYVCKIVFSRTFCKAP